MTAVLSLEIGILTEFYFFLIVKNNEDHNLNLGIFTHLIIWIFSIIGGIGISFSLKYWGIPGQLSCGALASYLLTASITDIQTYEVYDFLPVVTAIVGLGVLCMDFHKGLVLPLLTFIGIQSFLFIGMYGRADGYAFMVCALFESRFGQGMLTYLLHMGVAFLLLGIIQGILGNINRMGDLKHSVAFLPYIAVTVWWFL